MSASFAALLNAHMQQAAVNQSALARRIDCDHSYVSRLLHGEREPSAAMVKALADALGLPPGDPGRDDLLLSAGFKPHTAMAALSCSALLPLDAAWLDADDAGRGWLETGVALLLDGARARKSAARVISLRTMERRESA